MGFTHYFELKENNKMLGLKKLQKEVQKILDEHKDIIQYEYDENKPAICEVKDGTILIKFNGINDDGHETFYFDSSEVGFNFCKTARKPYDIVVCKVLLLLHAFYGRSIDITSDGFKNNQPTGKKYKFDDVVESNDTDGVWGTAIDWYNKTYEPNLNFSVNDVYGDGDCYFSYIITQE